MPELTTPPLPPAVRIAYLEEVVIGTWALLTGAGDPDEASRDWIRENVSEEVREILERRTDLRGMLLPAGSEKRNGPAHASRMRLLGKRVRVKLDKNVVQEGTLLGFGEGGDFEIQQDDGFVYHAWPLLAIREITDG